MIPVCQSILETRQISHLFSSALFTIPLKIWQNSQESSCTRISFSIKLQALALQLYWKRTLAQVTFAKFLRTPFLQNTYWRLLSFDSESNQWKIKHFTCVGNIYRRKWYWHNWSTVFWFLCGISLFVFIGGFRVFDFLINIIVLLKFSIEIEMFNLLMFWNIKCVY